MKTLILFLLVLVGSKSCSENQEMADATIEYKAMTRGYQLEIKLQNDSVFVSRQTRNDKVESNRKLSEQEKNTIVSEVKKIDLETLAKLEPPSKKHQFDGAAAANLSVTSKGKTYTTKTFDHRNPPMEISDLVNKITAFEPKQEE